MGKSKHTAAQIIAALKQVEAGRTVDEVACDCGVSQAICARKAKFGGDGRQRSPAAAIAGR
jgi:putative transposase